MEPVEIKKGIYWVGAIDWDLKNFHGYQTLRGSSYNAYLIMDEKITLIDTVKEAFTHEMIERISKIVDPSKIDVIVSNHVEMDHSGALPQILKYCPHATLITSPNGEKGLRKHYGNFHDDKVVTSFETFSIGKRTLQFVLMPMVHWPDSMATYIPEEKILFPNDAFGQHIASTERFDDEIGPDIVLEESAKYYANIVLPFERQVQKVLKDTSGLAIGLIAPSHGVIWRSHIPKIVELYDKWSKNIAEEKAVVIYDTMWHSTEKMAHAITSIFEDQNIPVERLFLQDHHISDVMTHVLNAKYICVGCPTLNNGLLPTVAAFLCYLKGLAPKGRVGLAFGSYGWGGQSIPLIEETFKALGYETLPSQKVQYVPQEMELSVIRKELSAVLKK